MGISERKEREKVEKKQMIMAAALKMFLEEGYAKTSIRNIADAIEYSPGTIYLYYKDKDELLYDVQGQAYIQLLEVFKKKATSKDPLKRLRQIGKTYISFGLTNPELYDLMFIIRAPTNVNEQTHKDHGKKSFDYLIDCLNECMAKNLVRIQDATLGSLQMWATVHGLVSLNLRCRLKMLPEGVGIEKILYASLEDYIDLITV
ncbi:TetR/AcrR family transcriptional regulator [Pedobacter sp. L105]|uniref:TetR/AcrR family transcriptional regulator n=1 Tax=Pedobacter sp. L105 TaxID=1641871 RepID=UPI00131AB3FA|nr:TetR/AcrR family transcriptional regulator [Pedobacter sp. L105]